MATSSSKDTGKVNIHGKQYETVASRVQRFREAHGDQYGLATEIIERTDQYVVVKATICDHEGRVIATGHAEERRDASQINRTSALENAETSAIGRCLSAFGMGGTEFASADEVANAIHQQSAPTPQAARAAAVVKEATAALAEKPISEAQGKMLLARARDRSGLEDWVEIRQWFVEQIGKQPNDVTRGEFEDVLHTLDQAGGAA